MDKDSRVRVLCELRRASSLLPLCCAQLDLPWSTSVYATEFSDTGYGVCERQLERKRVAEACRVSERWRFKFEAHVGAREAALQLGPALIDPCDPGASIQNFEANFNHDLQGSPRSEMTC